MKRFISVLALSAAALLCSVPANAISVTFTPASSHINIGDSVDVQMSISGLGAEILSAFDINLLFDESIVDNVVVVHEGVVTAFGGLADAYWSATFGVGDTAVIDGSFLDDATLAASQANDLLLLTFSFVGMGNGVTTLMLGADLDFERNFVGLDFATLDVDVGTACIAVGTGSCDGGQVPEPGTLALLALGLVGLGIARRRRN